MPPRTKGKNPDLFFFEQRAHSNGYFRIAGIDEVGRGPLAGPVVASAVVLPDTRCKLPLADSKTLTPQVREELDAELRNVPGVQIGVGVVEPDEIDRINILRASHKAMQIALRQLRPEPDFALVDGLKIPEFPLPADFLVKGDSRSASIAAASIIAKVYRDRIMMQYDAQFPGYGFAQHKGYATRMHLDALQQYGSCAIHRQSFKPVTNPVDLQLQLPFLENDLEL